jgi:hypothetical protein
MKRLLRNLLTTGGGCRLWEAGSWKVGSKVGGATGWFSPNGRLLAVEDSTGAIRLVHSESGAELARLEAPEQTRLAPVCFIPDGTRQIAVGIDTQPLRIWDLAALHRGLVDIGLGWEALPELARAEPAVAPVPLTITDRGRSSSEVKRGSPALRGSPDPAERCPALATGLLAPPKGRIACALKESRF